MAIDFQIRLHVSAEGVVPLAGGNHDSYPSYEIWVYAPGEAPLRKYYQKQARGIWSLRGSGHGRQVPNGRSERRAWQSEYFN